MKILKRMLVGLLALFYITLWITLVIPFFWWVFTGDNLAERWVEHIEYLDNYWV